MFQRLRDLILVCLVYLVLLRLPLVSSCLGDKRVMPAEGWHSAGEENLRPRSFLGRAAFWGWMSLSAAGSFRPYREGKHVFLFWGSKGKEKPGFADWTTVPALNSIFLLFPM